MATNYLFQGKKRNNYYSNMFKVSYKENGAISTDFVLLSSMLTSNSKLI